LKVGMIESLTILVLEISIDYPLVIEQKAPTHHGLSATARNSVIA
jgi:hypothetical protein